VVSIPQTVSPAHAGVSCCQGVEPAGRDSGMRRRSGGGDWRPTPQKKAGAEAGLFEFVLRGRA